MTPDYGFWADVVGVIHMLFVLFVVGGQALILAGWGLKWAWTADRAFRYAHLGAIGYVVVQQWLGRWCPLTIWESELRQKAGRAGYDKGFIETWLDALLYYSAPGWVFTVVYTLFGALVVVTFVCYRPGGNGRDRPEKPGQSLTTPSIAVRSPRRRPFRARKRNPGPIIQTSNQLIRLDNFQANPRPLDSTSSSRARATGLPW